MSPAAGNAADSCADSTREALVGSGTCPASDVAAEAGAVRCQSVDAYAPRTPPAIARSVKMSDSVRSNILVDIPARFWIGGGPRTTSTILLLLLLFKSPFAVRRSD